jgi:hypothetical protein
MHVSLDSALGRQRRLNQIGESITQIAPDPAAAYSLRSLTGSDPKVVRVRRGSDNDERDFTASEVSSGALTSYVNAQVVAPLDLQGLEADGRTDAFVIAKAAYSLRSLGTRQATIPNDAAPLNEDTVVPASGKYVCQVRRNVNGDLKSFTADEVSDGTLTSFVNESFTSSLPLDVAGSAAAAYGLRDLTTGGTSVTSSGDTGGATTGKFVVQVRRASDNTIKSFTAAEVSDGTLLSFVNQIQTVGTAVNGTGSVDNYTVTNLTTTGFSADNSAGGTGSVGFPYAFGDNDVIVVRYTVSNFSSTSSLSPSVRGVNGIDNVTSKTTGTATFTANGTYTNTLTATADGTHLMFADGNTGSYTISDFEIVSHSSSGFVETWYDQSGNSKNATQGTAANQPKIVDAGALVNNGGKPALRFDGTSHRLELSAKATIANTSIFSAFRSNDSTQDSVLFHLAVNASNVVSIGFGDLATRSELGSRLRVGGTDLVEVGDNAFTSTSQSLLSYIASSTAAKMFVDSTEKTATVESRNSGGNNRIGARGNDEKFFNGDISEVILYDTDQTDKRRAIEESIATANGITLGSFNRDGFVKTWYDQSVSDQSDAGSTPNGNHATQATADNQPKIVSAGSLLNELDFDGTDQVGLITGSFSLTQTFSAFSVSHSDDASTSQGVWSTAASAVNDRNFVQFFRSDNGFAINADNTLTTAGTIDYVADRNYLQTSVVNGSSSSIFVDGATGATGNAGSSNPSGVLVIGYFRSSGNNFNLDGGIKELILYDTDQTDNRTAIEANIGEAYSIDLPSGVDPGFDQVDGFVETWYDQSGNVPANDAVQATADNQPKIVSAGSLVSGGIEFDGSNDKLDVSYSSSGTTNAYLLTAVATIANSTGNQTILATGSGSWGGDDAWLFKRRSGLNNELAIETSNGGAILSPANYTSLESLVVAQGDSTDTKLFSNGSEVATGSVITIETQNIQIGNRANASILSGKINEIIVYFTDQSANRTAIEANINGHYSIF